MIVPARHVAVDVIDRLTEAMAWDTCQSSLGIEVCVSGVGRGVSDVGQRETAVSYQQTKAYTK